jgi:hypothetical protein
VLTPQATHDLQGVPQPIRRRVSEGMAALGIDPTGLSKPIRPPLTSGQAYEFSFLFDDMECWVASVFQYDADEQTLHVIHIRWEVL